MDKIIKTIILVLMISIAVFPAFSDSHKGMKVKDGVYFASENNFNPKSGWKYCVTAVVKKGNLYL